MEHIGKEIALSGDTEWHNDNRKLVVQDNELIRSAYTMPLLTQRLFMLALSKIRSEQFPRVDTCIGVVITADEWGELFGRERQWRDLKAAAKDLMKRQLVLRPMAKTRKEINFCDSTTYYDGLGKCEIKFGYSISVYLAGLMDQFTQMDLLNLSRFKSRNTVRLYELLSQMRTRDKANWWLKITLDEFRVVMGFEGDKHAYKRTAELKRAVIEPSIKEINAKSDLKVEVQYLKEGRTITGLHFTFRDNDQLQLI